MENWYKIFHSTTGENTALQDYFKLNISLENDCFWYDKIKEVRSNANKRLEIALENLPLPAAFKEIAIALRALIKEGHKNKDDVSIYIKNLYQIACIRSFMLDYASKLKEPGYNVMLSIPGGMLFKLEISYSEIGSEKLELLTKADKKLIIEKFGEPKRNSTMNEIYTSIWDEAEEALIKEKKNRNEALKNDLLELLKN